MRYLLPGFLLLQSIAAMAQDTLDEIVTTAQRRDHQFDVAGNIAQVGEDELDLIKHQHIQESLVRVPGVNFHRNHGQEYLPSIRSAVLFGAGACGGVLTAQDNIPLRAAGFCNVNEMFEAYTEQAERVEVIRGPSNALYGSNALHGVVNVILPSAPEQSESRFGLELGPSNFRRSELYHGGRSGDHGFVANITATHDGGYRDEAYYDQQKMQLRHETEVIDWEVATTFAATNLNQETAGYIEGDKAYEDEDLVQSNPNPEAYRDARSFRLYSRMETTLAEGGSVVITPYARKTEMDFLQHFLPFTPLEENGQESLGVMSTLYQDQGEDLTWILGLDAEFTDGYLRETQNGPTSGPFPSGRHYDYQVNAVQAAPFAQVDWSFAERWQLNAGLRLETMRYDYDNRMISGNTAADGSPCRNDNAQVIPCRYSRPADRDDQFNNVSPQVGLQYQPNDAHRLFANVAQGFRAPQATELYRLQQNQVLADLQSEEVLSVELGARGQRDRLAYEANLYAMEKENVIFRDPDFRNNLGDGETEHRGVELSLGYNFDDIWDLGAVLNYAEHRYASEQSLSPRDIEGNLQDSAPRHFGTVHLGWRPADAARVELELVHTGPYYTEPENQQRYEGHDILNLRSQWTPLPNVEFSLNILNLTAEMYASRADWNSFDRGVDRYFPGEPRSAYLGLDLRF